MSNLKGNNLVIALAVTFLLGLALYAAPTLIDRGISWATATLIMEALGISLFVAPVSIVITLLYSTGKTERRINDVWQALELSDQSDQRGGITRSYPDRAPALAEFLNRCKHASEIDILGIALPQLTGSIPQLSEFAKHARVRVAVIDPIDGPLLKCIEWMFPSVESGTEQTARGNIERVSSLAASGVEVYKYKTWPMASIMRVDDVMFISPYIYKVRGADSPTLRLVRQVGGIFDVYCRAFDSIINDTENVGIQPTSITATAPQLAPPHA